MPSKHKTAALKWGDRLHLSPVRDSVTHKVTIGGVQIYIIVGLFPNGEPGELFIKAGGINSLPPETVDAFGIQGWCDKLAELMSVCLQYGAPLESLCRHLVGSRFKPNGLTTEPGITFAASISDYVGKWLVKMFPVLCPELHENFGFATPPAGETSC